MVELAAGAGIALTKNSAQNLVRISVEPGVLATAGFYPTTAAGIAGTVDGEYFFVVVAGADTIDLYKNVAEVAVAQVDWLTLGGVENELQPFVDAAESAAANANATSPLEVIGPASPTPSAVSLAAHVRLHARPIDFTPTGTMVVTVAGGPVGGTFKLKTFVRSDADTFTQTGSDFNITVPAEDTVTVDTGIIPNEGEYIGGHGVDGVIATQPLTGAEGEHPHYVSVSSSNVSSFDATTTILTQLALKIEIPRGVAAMGEDIAARSEEVARLAGVRAVLGPERVTPSSSTATSGRVRLLPVPIRGTPISTAIFTLGGAGTGGPAVVKFFTKSGNVFTQVGEDIPAIVPAEGEVTIDTGVIPEAGQYVGAYSGTGGLALGPTPFMTRYEGPLDSNTRSFTAATTTGTTAGLQLKVEYRIAEAEAAEIVLDGWTGFPVDGQSLGIGSQGQPALSVNQPYDHLTFENGPKSVDAADMDATKALVEDNLDEGAVAGTTHGETVTTSQAVQAARLAAIENGIDPARFVIFGFTGAHAGAAIEELQKGASGGYFERFMGQVQAAKDLADAAGKRFVIPAVSFLQGESDSADSELTYRINLEQIASEIEVGIQEITGQTSPVHLLMYQTGYLGSAYNGGPARAQLHASNDSIAGQFLHCVTPTYHIGRAADGVHMTNLQYIRLGHYLGRAFHQLVNGQKPANLRALSCTAEGTAFRIKFAVPTLPLVIDTSDLAVTTNHGIKISDDTGTLTLSNLAVDGDSITGTTHRALGANPICRIGMDYLGTGLTITYGASTNLRDSTADTFTFDGTTYDLYHVAMADQLTVVTLADAS